VSRVYENVKYFPTFLIVAENGSLSLYFSNCCIKTDEPEKKTKRAFSFSG
jgi:hypothetical protein